MDGYSSRCLGGDVGVRPVLHSLALLITRAPGSEGFYLTGAQVKLYSEKRFKKEKNINFILTKYKLTGELFNSGVYTIIISIAVKSDELILRLIDGFREGFQGMCECC